jgi:magnesium-transporting ATPase (P-type)
MSPSGRQNRLLVGILMLSLCVWGGLLAAGAYLLNLDARKAYIVLACVVGFLGLWTVVIVATTRKKRRNTQPTLSGGNPRKPMAAWNGACLTSTLLAVAGWLVLAIAMSKAFDSEATLALALLVCLGCSAVLGIVGLSNPGMPRGKVMCMLGLASWPILLIVSTLAWPS